MPLIFQKKNYVSFFKTPFSRKHFISLDSLNILKLHDTEKRWVNIECLLNDLFFQHVRL
jgi:hypothetical protein